MFRFLILCLEVRLKCLIQSEKLRLKYRKELKSDKRFALQENDLVRSDFSLVEETLFWSQRSIFLKNFQKNRKNYESLSKRPQQEKNLIKFRFFFRKDRKNWPWNSAFSFSFSYLSKSPSICFLSIFTKKGLPCWQTNIHGIIENPSATSCSICRYESLWPALIDALQALVA